MHSAEGESPSVLAHTSGLRSPLRGGLGVARHQWVILGRGQLGETVGAQTSSAALQMAAARPRPQRLERPFSQNGEREGRECPSEFGPAPEDSEGQLATRRAGARPGEEAAVAPATTRENEGGRGLGGIAAPRVSPSRKDRGRARAAREGSAGGERDRSGPSTPIPMPLSRLLLAVLK